MKLNSGHEGERTGPKALRYAQAAQDIEDQIASALPGIVTKLISMATEGHLGAAKYLCDRILGRCTATPNASGSDNHMEPSNANDSADLAAALAAAFATDTGSDMSDSSWQDGAEEDEVLYRDDDEESVDAISSFLRPAPAVTHPRRKRSQRRRH